LKVAANPQGPIAGEFSDCQIRKFERALSTPALLPSSHDSRANGSNDDDDVDPVSGYAANPFLNTPTLRSLPNFAEPSGATTSENKISLSLPE
jgi:hypothetical protein